MSNFKCKIKILSTGEIKDAEALDNHYGPHQYGYYIGGDNGKNVFPENEIELLECEPVEVGLERQSDPLRVQISGNHYKDFKIQPIEFIHANKIPFEEGNIIKYICRWRNKGGVKDLEKVKHYCDLLIKFYEEEYPKICS